MSDAIKLVNLFLAFAFMKGQYSYQAIETTEKNMDSKNVLSSLFVELGVMSAAPQPVLNTADNVDRDIQRASDLATDRLADNGPDSDEDGQDEINARINAALLDAQSFREDAGDILLDGVDDLRLMLMVVENLKRENNPSSGPVIAGWYRAIGKSLHDSLHTYCKGDAL